MHTRVTAAERAPSCSAAPAMYLHRTCLPLHAPPVAMPREDARTQPRRPLAARAARTAQDAHALQGPGPGPGQALAASADAHARVRARRPAAALGDLRRGAAGDARRGFLPAGAACGARPPASLGVLPLVTGTGAQYGVESSALWGARGKPRLCFNAALLGWMRRPGAGRTQDQRRSLGRSARGGGAVKRERHAAGAA